MIKWTELVAHLIENGVTLKQKGTTITAYVAGGQDQTETIHLHEGKKTEFSEATVAKICGNLGIPNME